MTVLNSFSENVWHLSRVDRGIVAFTYTQRRRQNRGCSSYSMSGGVHVKRNTRRMGEHSMGEDEAHCSGNFVSSSRSRLCCSLGPRPLGISLDNWQDRPDQIFLATQGH